MRHSTLYNTTFAKGSQNYTYPRGHWRKEDHLPGHGFAGSGVGRYSTATTTATHPLQPSRLREKLTAAKVADKTCNSALAPSQTTPVATTLDAMGGCTSSAMTFAQVRTPQHKGRPIRTPGQPLQDSDVPPQHTMQSPSDGALNYLASPSAGSSSILQAHQTPTPPAKLVCDKCDGNHYTDKCPHYPNPRENHPDALRRKPPEMGRPCGNVVTTNARVVRQPGDGSCLFHSLCYGLEGGGSAGQLRRELSMWVRNNPNTLIADTPLQDWLWWDSKQTPQSYASSMSISGWGGGIEMAACSRLKGVDVHVWEQNRKGPGYRRISCFDAPATVSRRSTVNVLYQGGVHYDALVLLNSPKF